ncbi:MAG: DNA-protecting protein DprA [Alphaproteobacteria bacterium]|nr:DNA-protecting protein DprA [Alphaproteobacteria bacterium]
MKSLSDRERRDWLRLARTQTVGPVTFAALLARFGSAAAALEAIPRLAQRGGAKLRIPSIAEADQELGTLARLGGRFVASCEPDFPPGLGALDPPPPLIAVLGDLDLLPREMVAIVGARNASALGRRFAATLANEIGQSGLIVASGLARGIDTAAHQAALPTGTCAVLADGVDVVYPAENTALYAQICAEGAVVSEMPMGESPQARHFPRRNRIISGLSRGVVIVEAAENSGSLITARFALEQGREVFAVPGSPLDPRARGANHLIREGATLIESADDVVAALRPILGRQFEEPPDPGRAVEGGPVEIPEREADGLRARILQLLAPSPADMDELIRDLGSSVASVAAVLLELELAGRAQRHPGNRFSLT